MARIRIPVLCTLITLLAAVLPTQALYFYIDGSAPKCFYEELPKDTLVVGHYTAEEFNPDNRQFENHHGLKVLITVDETFDADHRIVSQTGTSKGKFTFSAGASGDHKICFTPAMATANGGWLSHGGTTGSVRLTLDLAIGSTSAIESTDKSKIQDIVQRVKDLNGRLEDIKREQMFQREREAEFRDQSEATNSRVVKWTMLQMGVLGATCAWQLSHLRAFFIKQKLT
ncbi:MAG: emp24p/erv25p- protein [Trizodia sp. TS-e1964]|nr:MAG: emp24p/erv25p- protein [Trizodia sp. TS-e1964]